MRRLKFYFTLVILVFFINIQAQKNDAVHSHYSIFRVHSLFQKTSTHPITLRDDISKCQSNIKVCLDKCVKVLKQNTFHFKKVGYVNEEGIVFNAKKRLRFVIWYGI